LPMKNSKVIPISEIQHVEQKPFYEQRWFRGLGRVLSLLGKVPPIRRYFSKTVSGMLVRTFKAMKDGDYEEALRIAHLGINKCRTSKDSLAPWHWWEFMSYAVRSTDRLDNSKQKALLMSLAEDGLKPAKGCYPAYCFCYFSRWKYLEGNFGAAVDYARKAKEAEELYAEADFLLGWYALFIYQENPISHFKSAIEKDRKYLYRITHEPELIGFPHIIQELKDLQLVVDK
jgi:hypothetical protein